MTSLPGACMLRVFSRRRLKAKLGVLFQTSEGAASSLSFLLVLSHSLPLELRIDVQRWVTSLWTEGQVHTAIYNMEIWRKSVSLSQLSHSEKKQMQNEVANCVSVLEQARHSGVWLCRMGTPVAGQQTRPSMGWNHASHPSPPSSLEPSCLANPCSLILLGPRPGTPGPALQWPHRLSGTRTIFWVNKL